MAKRKDAVVSSVYPFPSFVKGSMLSKHDPVMVGEFWAPEIYEYIWDERMTEQMQRDFLKDLFTATVEFKTSGLKEEQNDSTRN